MRSLSFGGKGIRTVNENRWERYGAAAGVAFAVLVLVSYFMVPSPPHVDAGFRKIGDYYANHRRAILTSNLIGTFAALAFIWFLGHLRHVLNRAEGGVEDVHGFHGKRELSAMVKSDGGWYMVNQLSTGERRDRRCDG